MTKNEATVVHALLSNSASRHPEKIAFIQDGQRASYRHIDDQAGRLAGWLAGHGVHRGDRVVLLLENSLEYVISYYGVLRAGAVAVPLNPELGPQGLVPLMADLEPRVVICGRKAESALHAALPLCPERPGILLVDGTLGWEGCRAPVAGWHEVASHGVSDGPLVAAQDLASIIYTSGSTGKPKGVMLTHGNLVANIRSIVAYLELTERDVQMVVLPFFYVMGKSLLNTHVAATGTVVVNNGFAYPASVVAQMAKEGVTGFSGVPATYAYLLHRSPLAAYRDRLPALRYCTQAGGHLSRQVKEQLIAALPPQTQLYIMYGATEAAARLTYVEPQRLAEKMDSIGRPIPGVEMRVLDIQGQEAPVGATGELVASGPNIMQGYWKDPQATALALDRNGYHTGDLGYQDADGYLYVTGRKDDLLKVGGHRVDPQEIEDVLMATGLLLEVAVLGLDDALLGKKLVALGVPLSMQTGVSAILAPCRSKLPRHKVPADLRYVGALPKYPSGKIDKAGCLARYTSLLQAETPGAVGCQTGDGDACTGCRGTGEER
jgi:acyl-CoA synthetase (AMP-forming)/AMP-acid ligase II